MIENPLDWCEFVKKNILPDFGANDICPRMNCNSCTMLQTFWMMQEYEEPKVDWSKVKVDTPILVWDGDGDEKLTRHFAKYEDDMVFAWEDGMTSWSTKVKIRWEHAKPAGFVELKNNE